MTRKKSGLDDAGVYVDVEVVRGNPAAQVVEYDVKVFVEEGEELSLVEMTLDAESELGGDFRGAFIFTLSDGGDGVSERRLRLVVDDKKFARRIFDAPLDVRQTVGKVIVSLGFDGDGDLVDVHWVIHIVYYPLKRSAKVNSTFLSLVCRYVVS